MEIKNKALVKHEIRNIWPLFIYFIGCMILEIYRYSNDLHEHYLLYLRNGYGQRTQDFWTDSIYNISQGSIFVLGIGVTLLLYLQFKDNKSLQVSGFIKSLPYTQQEVYYMKLVSGIVTITVPMLIGAIGILSLRIHAQQMLTYAQQASLIGSKAKEINGLEKIILQLVLTYSITVFVYLLGFWMQYLVNSNIVSIVMTGLCLLIMPINVMGYGNYVTSIFNTDTGRYQKVEIIAKALTPLTYVDTTYERYRISEEVTKTFRSNMLYSIEFIEIKLIIVLVLMMMLLMAIILCNKNYKAENQEGFFSVGWAEKVFKLCGVISAIGASSFVASKLIGTYSIGQKIVVHIIMGAIGVVSYLIVNKICLIGKR